MRRTLISIITPLHNKGPYIAETIQSVLSQTMRDWEMIVVENGSNDDGPDIVSQFSDTRISLVIADSTVRGPGAARNVGFQRAKGKWILFLDADDLLEPDYLAQRLTVLEKYPDATVVAGPWQNFRDDTPGVLEKHLPNGWKPPFGPPPPSTYAYSPWALHAAIVRRDILSSTPWLPELDKCPAEDNAFWFRTLFRGIVHWQSDPGALYRQQTPNSRDRLAHNMHTLMDSVNGTFLANRRFLSDLGCRPNTSMAATAVRVLENLQARATLNKIRLDGVDQIMQRELSDTSFFDLRMLARRLFPHQLAKMPRIHKTRN